MYDAPELVHRLLRTVTTAFLNWQRYVRSLTGAPPRDLFMGADAAEMLKPALFREFVLPYYVECYEAFPGERGLHMCGKIDHLLPILAEEMKLTQLNGFGAVTNPQLLAQWLSGKAYMTGGPDPILLWKGTPDEIRRACWRYLDLLAPKGGYVLQDGHGLAPGTPLANLNILVQAARAYQ
jgi:uroporphyrinogen-III decarboxylase